MVEEFRRSIISDSTRNNYSDRDFGNEDEKDEDFSGVSLYEVIFKKIEELVPEIQDCKHILISPDGQLNLLPFEALPIDDKKQLIDKYQISYLSVGRDILRFGNNVSVSSELLPKRETSEALVIADPDFDIAFEEINLNEQSLNTIVAKRLTASKVEGEQVANLIRAHIPVTVKMGRDATQTLLETVQSPPLLHLSTHGFVLKEDQPQEAQNRTVRHLLNSRLGRLYNQNSNFDNPLRHTGITLAGFNTWQRGDTLPPEAKNGFATAENISGLDLLDTELVVVAACQTALGIIRIGEGVFGLRRAFILAGAKTLIISLWKVDDLATTILMTKLYENLLTYHMGRAEALRESQLYLRNLTVGKMKQYWLKPEMIKQLSQDDERIQSNLERMANFPDDNKPFFNPYYWGAFICQGDPAPLSLHTNAETCC